MLRLFRSFLGHLQLLVKLDTIAAVFLFNDLFGIAQGSRSKLFVSFPLRGFSTMHSLISVSEQKSAMNGEVCVSYRWGFSGGRPV